MSFNSIMQKTGKQIVLSLSIGEETFNRDEIIQARPYFNADLVGTVMKGCELELKRKISDQTQPIFLNVLAKYREEAANKIYGPYYPSSETYNADKQTYTYQCYDQFVKSMIEYEPLALVYPTTIFNIFIALVEKMGWSTDIVALPNGNKTVDRDIYEGIGYTYRNVFDDIGQACATLFTIENGVVKDCMINDGYIADHDDNLLATDDSFVFGATFEKFKAGISVRIDDDLLKNRNIEMGQHFGPINSIVLARSGDSDKIYMRDESAVEWCEYMISDNQLMNDNNRSDFLPEIYNRLCGIEYDIFDCELIGYGYIKPLEKVKFVTYGKTYISFVFNCEETFTKGYKQSIYTDYPEGAVMDYKSASDTDKLKNEVYLIVDKQKKEIYSKISSVEEGLSSQIKQTSDKLSVEFVRIDDVTYQNVKTNFDFSEKGLEISGSSNGDQNKTSMLLSSDGVDIKDKDGNSMAQMRPNQFRTGSWVMQQTNNNNSFNIFKEQ